MSLHDLLRSSTRFGMPDPRHEIAEIEAEIEALIRVADRCRKVIVLAKLAAIAGGLLLAFTLTGLVPLGPLGLVMAITAVLGGIALFGSHTRTLAQVTTTIKAHEARRAELIDGMALQIVDQD